MYNGYHGNTDILQTLSYKSATKEMLSALHQASADTERSNRLHIMGRENHVILAVSSTMSGLSLVVNSTVCVCVISKIVKEKTAYILLGYDTNKKYSPQDTKWGYRNS
jgi:hypothetical protein